MLSLRIGWPILLLLATILAAQVTGAPTGGPNVAEIQVTKSEFPVMTRENSMKGLERKANTAAYRAHPEIQDRHRLFVNHSGPNSRSFNRSWKYGDYSKFNDEGSVFPSWQDVKDYWRMMKKGTAKKAEKCLPICFRRPGGEPDEALQTI